MQSDKPQPANKKRKWLKEILFLLGMVALSACIALLLFRFQDFYSVSLRQYGWVAYIVIFLACMLSSATILVPAPGVAFILAAAAIWDPLYVAIAAGTGDALGEMTSYWVGYVGERMIVDELAPAYRKAVSWMDRYGTWAVFGIALIPIIPFDLMGMAAGALKIKWWKFLLATLGGKLPRAFLAAYLGYQVPLLVHPFFK